MTAPPCHIPRVAPIPLLCVDLPRAVNLGAMHLSINHVFLEDVVGLVIREFTIAPLRSDWQDALAASRADFEGER